MLFHTCRASPRTHHWLFSTFCQGGVLALSFTAAMSSSSRSEKSESSPAGTPSPASAPSSSLDHTAGSVEAPARRQTSGNS